MDAHTGKTVALLRWTMLLFLAHLLWPGPMPAWALTGPAEGKVARDADYGALPLLFIPNQGQFDSRVVYAVQGRDKSIFFTEQGLTFVLNERAAVPSGEEPDRLRRIGPPEPVARAPQKRWALKVDFVDANPEVRPERLEPAETLVSYFKGRPEEWRTGLRASRRIIYRDLWPGIDLIYSGTVNRIKYDFIVHPGADPDRIRLAWRGADSVQVTEAGQLAVNTPIGTLRDEMPKAWQEEKGRRESVTVAYGLQSPAGVQVAALATNGLLAGTNPAERVHIVGFTVGDYDHTRTLVLDPEMLVYCGFIGGSADDRGGYGIAVDGAGQAYVTGYTSSDETSFPMTPGVLGGSYHGSTDAFVAKVRADGTALVYCSYIGGSAADEGLGIAVNSSGQAYVVGFTQSTQATFPIKNGPDLTHNGDWDAFVARINADGTALVYGGFLGGAGKDYGYGIAVDSSGNAYVTGETGSDQGFAAPNFPVKTGPDQSYNGEYDAFVAKVQEDGKQLVYCGYIGGSSLDRGFAVSVDALGNAYVTGATYSDQASFPVKVGPSTIHRGDSDAFVAKVQADGSGLVYCGYIGGGNYDDGSGIAVDEAGNAYIAGTTASTEATFPVLVGPDLSHNGGSDAFVARIQAGGATLAYCGYIGGAGLDGGGDIAVDAADNAYVVGGTQSTKDTFPVRVGPDLSDNGGWDLFVAKISFDDFPWPAFLPAILEGGKEE